MTKNVKDYGVIGDGIADDTLSIQNTINTAYSAGEKVYIPSGRYKITSTLNLPFDTSLGLNKGNYIYGDGILRTTLFASAPNVTIFKLAQPLAYKFQYGAEFSDMSLSGSGLTSTVGISTQALYSVNFNNIDISGCTNGLQLINTRVPGDSDACNCVSINNSRIHDNDYWGIQLVLSAGNNETSFISLKNTQTTGNGTSTGAIGGGMYWRGQMLQFDNCAFAGNHNRGLYIEGGAGLGSNITGNNLCFENNDGMGIQCYGGTNMEFHNLQLYNNDSFKAQYGIYLNGSSSLVSNIKVHSAKVRATAGNNPYIAFCATGANCATNSIVVDDKQVRWDNFGYTGQTKYSGWTAV